MQVLWGQKTGGTILVVYFPRLFPLSVTTAVSASVIFEGMVSRPARVDDTVQQDFSKSTFPFLQITVHATLPFHQITVATARLIPSNHPGFKWQDRVHLHAGRKYGTTHWQGGGWERKEEERFWEGKGAAGWRRWRWRIERVGTWLPCLMLPSFTSWWVAHPLEWEKGRGEGWYGQNTTIIIQDL